MTETTPSLAESWSLPREVAESVEESHDGNLKGITSEVVPESVEFPPAAEKPDETMAEKVNETLDESNDIPADDKISEIPLDEKTDAKEEASETPEEELPEEEAIEEKRAIKLETAPADFRFPTTNQTRHCFTRYVEYHRCIQANGEEAPECDRFARYYRSLCPSEWVERWNEQRENGTFPGPL